MSETWSDVCESPTAVEWITPLVAVEINGFVGYFTLPDRGEGYREVDGFMIYTGTVRSRLSIRLGTDDFLVFGS